MARRLRLSVGLTTHVSFAYDGRIECHIMQTHHVRCDCTPESPILKSKTKKWQAEAPCFFFFLLGGGLVRAQVQMLYTRGMRLIFGMHSREHSTHIHASNTETNPER